MVNKRVLRLFIVCLSCRLDMGLFHVLGQEVPQLTLLMTLLLLAMTEKFKLA